ncbi:hypothetical protein [Maricaulis sp. MIT060901]|uniref:hypothetical protein n=1 Tax=Maricaulis sp. MIT060901 TaxID=3096993 RepID=UPI00399AEF17
MKRVVLSIAALLGVTSGALAQDHLDGVYDGREIAGWVHNAETSEAVGLPTWYPEGGAFAGANCNLETLALAASSQEWLEAFYAANPATVGAQLQASGVDWRQGYLTEVINLHGRPAMRNLWAGAHENQGFEAMMVSISGAEQLVIIRCSIQTGYLLPALQAFYQFASDIEIETTPPQ